MFNIEEKQSKELFTYKVLDGTIVRYEYRWAYSWEEGASELESEGLELVD